jgi:hypothetical protein
MTRQVNDTNQIWYERQDQTVKIGFTKSFLEGLDQCWHILPANLERFKAKAPLLTVETNDALISILSPVAGNFMQYSDKAQNFPDKLTEEDVILELRDGPVPQRQQEAPQVAAPDGRVMFGDAPQAGINWDMNPAHDALLERIRLRQQEQQQGAFAQAPDLAPRRGRFQA